MKVFLGEQKRGVPGWRRTLLVPREVVFASKSKHEKPYLDALGATAMHAFQQKKQLSITLGELERLPGWDTEELIEVLDNERAWHQKERFYRQAEGFIRGGSKKQEAGFAGADAIAVYGGVMHGIGLLAIQHKLDVTQVDALCSGVQYIYPGQSWQEWPPSKQLGAKGPVWF